MDEDLWLVSEAALSPRQQEAHARLLERYPELWGVRQEDRGEVLYRKLRVDLVAGIPRGIWLGLLPVVGLCVSVGAVQTAAAGYLIRPGRGDGRRWVRTPSSPSPALGC